MGDRIRGQGESVQPVYYPEVSCGLVEVGMGVGVYYISSGEQEQERKSGRSERIVRRCYFFHGFLASYARGVRFIGVII